MRLSDHPRQPSRTSSDCRTCKAAPDGCGLEPERFYGRQDLPIQCQRTEYPSPQNRSSAASLSPMPTVRQRLNSLILYGSVGGSLIANFQSQNHSRGRDEVVP